jgi:hypothetical protein
MNEHDNRPGPETGAAKRTVAAYFIDRAKGYIKLTPLPYEEVMRPDIEECYPGFKFCVPHNGVMYCAIDELTQGLPFYVPRVFGPFAIVFTEEGDDAPRQ